MSSSRIDRDAPSVPILSVVLAVAMVVAVFGRMAYGVLAPILVDEMDLSRTEVGWLVSFYALTGAALSIPCGRFIDHLGGRRSLVVLFGLSGLGLIGIALGINYQLLLVASMVAGLTQAMANPSTNKVIAHYVPKGKRGLPTGVKQSGVQVGIVIAGVVLPWGASSFGWRPTVAVIGVIAWFLGLWALFVFPADSRISSQSASSSSIRVSGDTRWLVMFGLTTGVVGGALLTYLPLFAEERIGLSVAAAGAASSVVGGFGIAGRVAWGHYSERLNHFGSAVAWLGLASALAIALLWSAEIWGAVGIWFGSALAGLSIMSWMSVLMLATMATAGVGDTGRTSGVVVLGFLIGQGVGPPAFGYMVDLTDRYTYSMAALVALCLVIAALGARWRTHSAVAAPT